MPLMLVYLGQSRAELMCPFCQLSVYCDICRPLTITKLFKSEMLVRPWYCIQPACPLTSRFYYCKYNSREDQNAIKAFIDRKSRICTRP